MTVHIGPLHRGDLARCAELERELFDGDDPWRESAFAAELAAGHHYVAARTDDGTLVGYAGIAVHGRPPHAEAEVHTIGVDPRFQRAGVGRGLLRALLARADERGAATFLEVRTDNIAAIELYRSEGFDIVGLRQRYYRPSGADAYTMRRPPAGGVPTVLDCSARHVASLRTHVSRTADTPGCRTADTPGLPC